MSPMKSWERFKVVKSLGAGGFGQTLLVEDHAEGGRLVVIKVPLDQERQQYLIDGLLQNAVLHASFKQMYHPNIVRFLGHGSYQDRTVMIMEYVSGSDLRKVIGASRHQRPPQK